MKKENERDSDGKKIFTILQFIKKEFNLSVEDLLNHKNDKTINLARLVSICLAYQLIESPSQEITDIYRDVSKRIQEMAKNDSLVKAKIEDLKKRLLQNK